MPNTIAHIPFICNTSQMVNIKNNHTVKLRFINYINGYLNYFLSNELLYFHTHLILHTFVFVVLSNSRRKHQNSRHE